MKKELPDSRPVHLHGARKVLDLSKGFGAESIEAAGAVSPAAMGGAVPEERIRVTLVLRPESDASCKVGETPAGVDHGHAPLCDLEDHFSPANDDVERVRIFAQEHSLEVVEVSRLRHDVVLEGTPTALSVAFNVELAHYEHKHGCYRAHDEPIHLPPELHDVVEAVLGLDDIPCHDRHFAVQMDPQVGTPSSTDSSLMSPLDVAEYYEFPADCSGSGQRIAILEFGGGYHEDDINSFLSDVGLPPTNRVKSICLAGGEIETMDKDLLAEITNAVNEDGQAAMQKYGSDFGKWTHMLEVTMDIELVAALAPEADIDVYFIGGSTQEFRRALYALAGDTASADGQEINLPTVITDSWGKTESGYTPSGLSSLNGALDTLRRSRITVCCASGDFGSVGLAPDKPATCANVCFPASSPFVLACGGTTLTDEDGSLDGEIAWNEQINGFHLASTGGISGHFSQPDWQSDAEIPNPSDLSEPGTWLSPAARANPAFRGRGVPDVAASADMTKGFRMILGGVVTAGGGTSAAAPLWASLLARINQKRETNLGWVNSRLYMLMAASAFRQAASGNNCVGEGDIPYYTVRPSGDQAAGWNACTGLGSPVGTALLDRLAEPEN